MAAHCLFVVGSCALGDIKFNLHNGDQDVCGDVCQLSRPGRVSPQTRCV